jgi:hypothetical protein
MKPVERQKMCPNCDGRIPQESAQCPYCFAQLQIDSSLPKSAATSTTDPLSALYPPPYSSPEVKQTIKTSSGMAEALPAEAANDSIPFWSILMLALGSNLLTLGILQFFFSDHGILRLEMNASYWFLMVIVAAPLIYFGLKNLAKK